MHPLIGINEPGPRLTELELSLFEREVMGKLPEDYKNFLLQCNGGMCEPPVAFERDGRVLVLPGFNSLFPDEEYGLRGGYAKLREVGVYGYLPIASTENEDEVCLSLLDGVGAAWLATYIRHNDIPIAADLRPLSRTFTAFMNMLFPVPEPRCEIVELAKHGSAEDLVQHLLDGHALDERGRNGATLICEAIKYSNTAIIDACLARGASLSGAIRLAVINDSPDVVRKFVEEGADVNEKDECGARPLDYVGGTALPGEEGAANRTMRDLLISLGARKSGQR